MRRNAFDAAGLLNPTYDLTFDYEFWMRLARRAKLRRIHVPLALSRMHRGNKSLGQRSAVLTETFKILRQHYAYVPVRWVYAFECHQADGRDHFFDPPKHSIRLYLKSWGAGIALNPNARFRYTVEWVRFVTWGRLLKYLRRS